MRGMVLKERVQMEIRLHGLVARYTHKALGRTYRIIFCRNSQSRFDYVCSRFSVHDTLNKNSACLVCVHRCHVPLLIPFACSAGS